jgi:ATP-dependent protease HslVU (ClpYQ) ATPase subunit
MPMRLMATRFRRVTSSEQKAMPTGERDLSFYIEQLSERVVGHEAAKKELGTVLRNFVMRKHRPVRHTLLLGPIGCGKGTLGRALCATVSPLPQGTFEHADDLKALLAREPPPKDALIFIRNIDVLCTDASKFEKWLEATAKEGTTVMASAAPSPATLGLQLVFEHTIELSALTPREIDAAMVHPSSALMEEVGALARKGVTIVMLPEAKRILRDAAIGSGRGMSVMRDFVRGLTREIPKEQRGDFMMDREVVDQVLRNIGLTS